MKKIISIIAFCVGYGFATAQTYSLEQLKQLATDHNYDLRSARNAIQQSKQTKSEALTMFFPQISASGFGFQNNKPVIDIDLSLPDYIAPYIPASLELPSSITFMKKGIYGSISAIQPVFMGGQIINGNKLAKVGVEASELKMELSQEQVEQTTEGYYWQVVSMKEKLNTLAAIHDMLEQLEKDVNNMVRVGAVNRNDLLQVQLRKGEVETATLEVENMLTTIRQLLAQHVGKAGETIDVTMPADFTMGKVPVMPVALRQDHQAALSATPEYRLLEKNVESQRLQHAMAVGQNLPSVGVGASYSYNDWFSKNTNAMIFVYVHVPISDWWGGAHNIKKKSLALDDAREQLQDNSQKLVIRMNNAWSAVETSHKKLQIAHDAIEQADENLRIHRDYYRVGTTKMTDLLIAQEQYQQARDRYTDAYASFQTKILEYRQATGQ